MSVFYVYQGDTYAEERKGEYLWSPKLNKLGGKNIGYTMMTKIKKEDFIIHNCNGKIVAISIAKSNCYESNKPIELTTIKASSDWRSDGYRIDTEYFDMDTPLIVTKYKKWLASNYKEKSAFTKNGTGKQQYMCSIDDEQAVYLLEEMLKLQNEINNKNIINGAILDIIGEKNSEYNQVEKDEINNIIENELNDKTEWKGKKEKQATTISSSTGREIPKRDPKIAAHALAHAKYLCEYDNEDRTFIRKNGKNYTEPHHLIPISKYKEYEYSLDVMENIVSLCSHCHNLLHYGRIEDKKVILQKLYNERIEALRTVELGITFEKLLSYYK